MKITYNREKRLQIIKVAIWILPLFLIFWLVDKNFTPRGVLEVEYNVNEKSETVINFAGKEPDRLIGNINNSEKEGDYQLITTTPVYFDVQVPRTFSKATVTMNYQNPDAQPIIKLGVKQSNNAYYYNDMAFFNENIENLADHWNFVKENDIYLWQKDIPYYEAKKEKLDILDKWYEIEADYIDMKYPEEEARSTIDDKNYTLEFEQLDNEYSTEVNRIYNEVKDKISVNPDLISLNDFINNFPDPLTVLKYNYNLVNDIEMPGYEPSSTSTIIDKSIRGTHEIYTYLGQGENLDFKFTFQDINRHIGKDDVTLIVYNNQNEVINEVKADGDGNANADGKVYPERRHQLLMENMPFGIYRIKLKTNDDDVFVKKIETKQHLLMFKGGVYLADNIEYNTIIDENKISATTLYSFNNYIKARTSHENGLQVIRVDDYNLKLENVQEENEIKISNDILPIVSPKNDVRISGDGFFAFSKDQIFDPNFSVVKDVDLVEDIDAYNYIIAKYPDVSNEGNWNTATASIEAPYLYFKPNGNGHVLNMIIDLPGLPENDRLFKINSLKFKFERNPITITSIIDKIKNYF